MIYYTHSRKTFNNIKEDTKMSVEKFRKLIADLPADMIVLIQGGDDVEDLATVRIEYHNDGRSHLILTYEE